MSEIEEVARAAAETSKFGTKALETTEKLASFVAKVFQEPIESAVGMIGDRLKFFRGDGTWQTPADTNTFRTVTIGGTSIGTSNALDISAGTNVTFGGTAANGDITINAAHPDISAADSSTNSGRTYIQSIGLDSNGHITSIATGTETVTDTTYTAGDGIGLTNEEFSVDGGVGITAITDGVKMTYPIAIDNSGTGPDASSGFRIAPSSTGGALWFDLS